MSMSLKCFEGQDSVWSIEGLSFCQSQRQIPVLNTLLAISLSQINTVYLISENAILQSRMLEFNQKMFSNGTEPLASLDIHVS